MTTIFYNGQNPFSGIAPTPLMSRSVKMIDFGNRWGEIQTFTLRGEITGNCNLGTGILAYQQQLLNSFSSNYKTLQIFDDSTQVLDYPLVKVGAIDFQESTYAGWPLHFEINLDVYPQTYFSGAYGVLNPKQEVTFNEGEDGIISITHLTSAKGFCTDSSNSNALVNARNWVTGQTGWNAVVAPQFISLFNGTICLKEIQENYDRLNAVYSVRETYVSDEYNTNVGILRYATDYNFNIENGISNMSVKGDLKGCLYTDINSLRSSFQSFDIFSEAVNQFNYITNRSDLNSFPITKTIGEDQTNKIISFDYEYNDDLRPAVYIDYNVAFQYDYENDIISVEVKADVYSKEAYNSSKWQDVLAVANQINLLSIANVEFTKYISTLLPTVSYLSAFPLNPVPVSTSRTDNQFATFVGLAATYNNRTSPPAGFDVFDYSMNFTPSIHQYKATPELDGLGQYYIFDFSDKTRASFNLEINAIGSFTTDPTTVLGFAQAQAMKIQNSYFTGSSKLLDNQTYDTSNLFFNRTVKVNGQWSAQQGEFTI